MLISHNWLNKYLPELNKYTKEEIAEALSGSLAEVEEIIPIRDELENVVVGEVLSVEKHPDSDKLSLCKVTTDGENKLDIVCGAPNVKENIKIALCLPGGTVYADAKKTPEKIEVAEIRGVKSYGMICSARELGLGNNHEGILILEDNLELGHDLTETLKDFVYEVENKSLSHRGDCFSHKGIARELSAILTLDLIEEEVNQESFVVTGEKKDLNIAINVDTELCSRFSAILIENLEVKPSPLWMQTKLTAVGERPINNIVDVTNYVMLDTGQPLHAYDYEKLSGKRLIVRKAKDEERVKTLDEREYVLDKDMVVVADNESVEDIAGIMGGLKSSVSEETKTIILEAANWDLYNIRRTSRKLGLRTEASTRFEKGQDPNLTKPALESAYILLTDLAHGELASDLFDHYPEEPTNKVIDIEVGEVNRMLTLSLTKREVIELLDKLHIEAIEVSDGTEPSQESHGTITVTIPNYRPDLEITEDLIEEVARLYGFDKFPPKLPEREIRPSSSYELSNIIRMIIRRLSSLGGDEIKSYSFVSSEDLANANLRAKDALAIKNPIAPELSLLRTSLVPSLLNVANSNQEDINNFSIFEIGRAVQKELNEENIHIQPWQLAMVDNRYSDGDVFSNIKGIVENLSELLNIKFDYEQGQKSSWISSALYHPYKFGVISINNQNIGVFGVLSPEVASNFSLRSNYGVLELNLEPLLSTEVAANEYKPLSKFPTNKRDLSFWTNNEISYSQITKEILSKNFKDLRSVELKDIYEEEKTSLTLGLIFQSKEKTLTDSEVDETTESIKNLLEKDLKLEIREE